MPVFGDESWLDEELKEAVFRECCRESVRNFAYQMEEKLRQNDYKGGWSDCSIDFLAFKLTEEFSEVIQALVTGKSCEEIRAECADLANVAMMISENISRNCRGFERDRA